jgi:hypothetical protein
VAAVVTNDQILNGLIFVLVIGLALMTIAFINTLP